MESRNGGCNSVANNVQFVMVSSDQQQGLPAARFVFLSIIRTSK